MKKSFLCLSFLIAIALSFLHTSNKVKANDYVQDAIEALQTSDVYVAPGTPGTDYNTPAELSVFLNSDLNVVLVMLPQEALADNDIISIAESIAVGLKNKKTIGLAVGTQVIGYSAILPEGVADDLMTRSDKVSNSTIGTLVTFSRNVQLWTMRNPLPTALPTPTSIPTPRPTMKPVELPSTKDVPISLWPVIIITFFLVIIYTSIKIKNTRDKKKLDEMLSQYEKK